MDVLSDLAKRIGQDQDAVIWNQKASHMTDILFRHMFQNGLPIARKSRTQEIIENDSLLPYLCIVLGDRLPDTIRTSMLTVLSGDRFRTAHGFATESPHSPFYRDDGYWRGPIWAPSTMLLADGLYQCHQETLAREIASQFASMVQKSGFAENFDARTGMGLRDRAYTWTSSVFLILTHTFLT